MLSAHHHMLIFVGLLFSSHAASQQPIKIDDANVYSLTNPDGIQFSSDGWSTVDQEQPELHYNSTYTWTQKAGANMIFFFRGTAIAYYADSVGRFGPVSIVIDGQSNTNVTMEPADSRYQQQMWSAVGLSEGDHQVVVSNHGKGDLPTNVLGFDYFEITPATDNKIAPTRSGPGASEIPPNAVLVDDSSDMISYSGSSWEAYNSGKFMGVFLGGTQSSSDSPGAAITFRFNGTAVWYFSDHQANNTVVSVSVDDDLPDIVNTASTSDVWLSQMLTWSKTGLADGPHTVTITHIGAAGTYINVDFFKYMPSGASPSSISATHSKAAPVGAIVGAVVGGVVLIAIIAGISI